MAGRVSLEAYKLNKSDDTLKKKIAHSLEEYEKNREILLALYGENSCIVFHEGNFVKVTDGIDEAYKQIRENFSTGLVMIVIPKAFDKAREAA